MRVQDSIGDESVIRISDTVAIPLSEIEISYSRSSGPGGQHVNKTSTQVELTFNVEQSSAFTESDREWLSNKLSTKLDSKGNLHVTSQESRSQLQNKNAAIEKFRTLLAQALHRPKKRKKTKPSKSSIETRLQSKKKQGEKKKQRREKW